MSTNRAIPAAHTKLRRLCAEAAARRGTPIPPLRQESPGIRWIERDNRLVIDTSGDDTDEAAAAEPITRQLHASVLRNAHAFETAADRLGNNPDWSGLAAAARRNPAATTSQLEIFPRVTAK